MAQQESRWRKVIKECGLKFLAVVFIIAWIVGSGYGIWSLWFSPNRPAWLESDLLQAFLVVGIGGAVGASVRNILSLIWYCTEVDEEQYKEKKKNPPSRCVHLFVKPTLYPLIGGVAAFTVVFTLLGLTSNLVLAFVWSIPIGFFVDDVEKTLGQKLLNILTKVFDSK